METELFEGVDEMQKAQFIGKFFGWICTGGRKIAPKSLTQISDNEQLSPAGLAREHPGPAAPYRGSF